MNFSKAYQSTKINKEQFADTETTKSDLFKVSINTLVTSSRPNSVEELSALLDDNGYYGRYTLDKKSVGSLKNPCVKVIVYLPDSVFTYEWPYLTYYDLSENKFGKRKKPRVIQNNWKLYKCMSFFLVEGFIIDNNLELIASAGSKLMGWATKDEYIKMIQFLLKVGLFKDGIFVLKTLDDLTEVHDNLFDYNYFLMD
jgi:hypothetical protein